MMLSNVAACLVGAAALVGAALTISSCATEESILFAVSDAGSGDLGSTSGGACTVDTACKVKFGADIYTKIIDGSAGCTAATLCHGGDTPQGNMILKPGDAHGAYEEFINYQLKKMPGPAGAYIVPCDKKSSRMLCNTALADGSTPYGPCGMLMPFGTLATKLTKTQLDTIAEWIACGAPEN
jgi:hypothetical protein